MTRRQTGTLIHWFGIALMLLVIFYDPLMHALGRPGRERNVIGHLAYAGIAIGFMVTLAGVTIRKK